jgi:hypothetical protein
MLRRTKRDVDGPDRAGALTVLGLINVPKPRERFNRGVATLAVACGEKRRHWYQRHLAPPTAN